MGRIFVTITQLRNLTDRRVRFQITDGCCLLPCLAPGRTRAVKQSRVMRCYRVRGSPDWKIRVMIDDRFTGIEMDPFVVLKYVRVVFTYERNEEGVDVLCVHGIPENCNDFLLRHKYFGCMRNVFWDSRIREPIDRADSRLATKLRGLEADDNRPLTPFVDTNLVKRIRDLEADENQKTSYRPSTSPTKKVDKHDEEKPKITDKVDKNDYKFNIQPEVKSGWDISHEDPFADDDDDESSTDSSFSDMEGEETKTTPFERQERGTIGVTERGRSREQYLVDHEGKRSNNMDSFVHVMLLVVVFLLVWLLNMLIV